MRRSGWDESYQQYEEDFSVAENLIEFSELDILKLLPISDSLWQRGMDLILLGDEIGLDDFLEFREELHKAVDAIGQFGSLYRNLAEAEFYHQESYYWPPDMAEFQFLRDRKDAVADMEATINRGSLLVYLFMFVNSALCECLNVLAEDGSAAMEKMAVVFSMCKTNVTISCKEGIVTERFEFENARDYFRFLVLRLIKEKTPIRKCAYCGRFFVPLSKKNTKYCDRVHSDGKSCKQLGPAARHHKMVAADPVMEAFERVKRRMYKRMDRTGDAGGNIPTPLDMMGYYQWLASAVEIRNRYQAGALTADEAVKALEPDKSGAVNINELLLRTLDNPVHDPLSEKIRWSHLENDPANG